jgi:hypothetical protein
LCTHLCKGISGRKGLKKSLNIYTLDMYVLLMFAFSTGPGGRREEEEGETGGKVAEGKVAQGGEVAP